jgi:putative membrane protein
MNLLVDHWRFDPLLVVLAGIALLHGWGVHNLNRRAPAPWSRRRVRHAALFYLGLATLAVGVASPIDYWSDSYLWCHMVQHLVLMLAAPALIVASAPWVALQHGLPLRWRRPVLRGLATSSWGKPLRWATQALTSPWVAVVAFNAVMVFWHLPGPFEIGQRQPLVHIWAEHGSFFVVGVAFWLQFINSRPFRVRLSPTGQMAAIFLTSVIMWLLAMALSLFSAGAWYPWYIHHEGSALSPFADQQIAAGVLWVCGDFWAIPAMVRAVRRLIESGEEGGIGGALDRLLSGARRRRGAAPAAAMALPAALSAHELAERQASAMLEFRQGSH